jgi:hypothetical protein
MEYPSLPTQTGVVPVIEPGVEGVLVIVIGVQDAALVPQAPVAVTHTLPEEEPMVTEIEVVP